MCEAAGEDSSEGGQDWSALRSFYREHGISDEHLDHDQAHRFVRLNPRFHREETLELLRSECREYCNFDQTSSSNSHCQYPIGVPWLHEEWGFFALPGTFRLAQSPCFQAGRLYGQDVSSGAAVAALMTSHFDAEDGAVPHDPPETLRILDLCCAPGLKLCAMADWLQLHRIKAQVIGVDISEPRTHVCVRVIRKYQIDPETSRQQSTPAERNTSSTHDSAYSSCVRIQVCCNDGTKFLQDDAESNLVFDSIVAHDERLHCGKRKRMNKSAKARLTKQLRQIRIQPHHQANVSSKGDNLFERVLVDAECSTDGSIRHMRKRLLAELNQPVADTKRTCSQISALVDSTQMEALFNLQKGLAANGFRLLKVGGTMIYSTCSLSKQQNESVVAWILATFLDSQIIPLSFEAGTYGTTSILQGTIPGTLRFLPVFSGNDETKVGTELGSDDNMPRNNALFGGGFFLAKLTKRNTASKSKA